MNINNQHQQQQNSCNMQPMTISQSIQSIQGHQGHQASQISSSINLPQLQNNVVMAKYLFYYQPYNDFQVYNITCKEISFDMICCHNCLNQNNVQPNNTHVFYFQHPVDKKIYKIDCEIVRYNYIVWMLNKIDYNVELNFNGQQQETFSKQHKENLEFHLKHYLTNYLAPINTFQQQPLDNSQGYININI